LRVLSGCSSATVRERVWSSVSSTRSSDDNDSPLALPLAFLITFKCYKTWQCGDPRGSIDPKITRSVTAAQLPYALTSPRAP
jgi:hypothetical protein